MLRQQLIDIATKKPDFKLLCKKINPKHGDDIFQEVCLHILEMPEDKLPQLQYFNFWFYRVAYNMISLTGSLGKVLFRKEVELKEIASMLENTNERNEEDEIKKAEMYMLDLPEFENRILLLYNELGNMKKVQKHTGVSYSALRYVKDKLKK